MLPSNWRLWATSRPRGCSVGTGSSTGGVMFGLVNSQGVVHLRVDDETRARFEQAGGEAHSKMPYVSVPEPVLANDDAFLSWASDALASAHAAKR